MSGISTVGKAKQEIHYYTSEVVLKVSPLVYCQGTAASWMSIQLAGVNGSRCRDFVFPLLLSARVYSLHFSSSQNENNWDELKPTYWAIGTGPSVPGR